MADKGRKALERLEKALYTKKPPSQRKGRTSLHSHDSPKRHGWPLRKKRTFSTARQRQPSFLKRLFLFSVAFFVITAAVFAFVFLRESNVISSKNVSILVVTPVAIEAGKEFPLQIIVENRNNIPLEFTDLIIEYPEGTRVIGAEEKELSRSRIALGEVAPGGIVKEVARTLLFGEANSTREIGITLEYRVRGSNAIFVAEKTHTIHISSSPINVRVDSIREISSGQELELTIEILSNVNRAIEDLLVEIDYPFGFSFLGAAPRPTYGNNVWKIRDLPQGGEKKIQLRGIIEGQDGEEKTFRVMSGASTKENAREVEIIYGASLVTVALSRPFLGIELLVDGRSDEEHSVSSGNRISADILWTNNVPTQITDAKIEARLSGEALDEASVSVRDGFYRSSDNIIVWDKGTNKELAALEPGERGRVSFQFSINPLVNQRGVPLQKPSVEITVSTEGSLASLEGVSEKTRDSVARVIKVNTDITLAGRAVYYAGPFKNTGSLPPRVDQETTYTITLAVANSSNDVSGGVVEASLPPYARWVGRKTPTSELVTFNENERKIRWDLGNISAGAGITFPPREVSFQIAFLPSISQIGQAPDIVLDQIFYGKDGFTGNTIEHAGRAINTRLSTDPQFKFGEEKVVE